MAHYTVIIDCYKAGYNAFLSGYDSDSHLHASGTEQEKAFLAGYKDAEREQESGDCWHEQNTN